ncbi:hypothetical protein D3C86_943220 [compost metagenome]
MANQLKKLALLQYTPGSPYVPGRPAYCTSGGEGDAAASGGSSGSVAGGSSSVIVTTDPYTGDPQVRVSYSGPLYSNQGQTTGGGSTTAVCYPAIPATQAVPPSATYTAVQGWNGGGRSRTPMVGDGAFTFEISAGTVATVVGLSAADAETLPNEPTHAFYVHQGVVDVMESGTVVATAPSAHDATKRYAISRTGTAVTYEYDGWVYTSATAATSEPVYLDAAIYASGDAVDDPLLTGPQSLAGTLMGDLPPMFGALTDALEYSNLTGVLPRLTSELIVLSGEVASLGGSLPMALLLASDRNYAQMVGSLPLPTMFGYGGFPEVFIATLAGVLPPLASWSLGYTGEVGTLDATLPPLDAVLVDRAGYGEVGVTLPAVQGFMLQFPETAYGWARSTLISADFYLTSRTHSAALRDGLRVSDSFTLTVTIDGELFDALALSDSTSGTRALTALIQSGLWLGGDAQQTAEVQYAVNVLTSALTTYEGLAFQQFALAAGRVYGVRPDGVYLLRPGDDNGSPISVYVDFGTSDFGTTSAKTVEAVYLGLDTDGEAVVTLRNDGVDRAYRVIPRGPLMRADAARGVTGRQWNLTLEVVDATELTLDGVEQLVAVATRRWTR